MHRYRYRHRYRLNSKGLKIRIGKIRIGKIRIGKIRIGSKTSGQILKKGDIMDLRSK